MSFGVAVGIGGTVGSGILRTPGEVAAQLRSPWLIIAIWVVGGIYAFFCTVSITELATMLPQEGGWYVYSRKAFGEYPAFVVGCCDWTMQSAAIAYLAVAFGEFTSQLQPQLAPYIKLIAVACVLVLALLNWLGLRAGSRAQELTSLVKALALVAFVAACFVATPAPSRNSGAPAITTSSLPPLRDNILLAMVVALQAVIVTYDGWYSAIYFMEEDRDPARNLPRSAIGGVIACIAIFVLVNVALLHVLPLGYLAASQTPASDAAMMILGSRGKQFILIISLITVVSTINALLLISPRILFAMGRDGLMPRGFASVNPGGTPAIALLASALVSIGLVLSGSFETLIAVASFLYVAVYLSGFFALFKLRKQHPELPRPFKAWGHPWTTLGVLVASAGFLLASVMSDLKHTVFTLLLIAISYPVYVLAVKKRPHRA